MDREAIIRVEHLTAAWGDHVVLDDISFDVLRGETFVILGGSGSGKSTLLKHMIGLHEPRSGRVLIAGEDLVTATGDARSRILRRFGVTYQSSALFGSMTVLENVLLPLEELTDLPAEARESVARAKLRLVGLETSAEKMPAELSGGMRKRAAIARAIALDPEILFLDEPAAGLDPLTLADLDDLLENLSDVLGITIVMVTHELPSIFALADRVLMVDALTRRIIGLGTPEALRDHSPEPWVRRFLSRDPAATERAS